MAIEEINKLKELDVTKQLAFAYLACERLYPNYEYFSKNYEFGSSEILQNAIAYIYDMIFDYIPDKSKIEFFIQKIELNIPEPANHDTILASSALDASTVILESLNFLVDKQTSRLYDISTMCLDTVDMYIQDSENLDYNNDISFQQKIDSHTLMIKEIATQKGIILYLQKTHQLQPSDVSTLLQLQNYPVGNLDIPKC